MRYLGRRPSHFASQLCLSEMAANFHLVRGEVAVHAIQWAPRFPRMEVLQQLLQVEH
jgi:hypothetical protein